MKLAIISAALVATVLGAPVDSATAVSSQFRPCIYRLTIVQEKSAAAIPQGVFFCVGYDFVPNCSYINPALGLWISLYVSW